MAPQCRPPTLLLLALAGLLLLTQAAPAAAARRAERKLLQAPVLRPSDTTKAATVDPAPAPPPGDPSLTLPGGAEKCAAPAPPSQRTGSSQPAAQEGSAPLEAPDITAGASTKSTLPAPSRTTKCLTPARPPTWEEWAVWLADKDEQLQVIMQGAWTGFCGQGGGVVQAMGYRARRASGQPPLADPRRRPAPLACRLQVHRPRRRQVPRLPRDPAHVLQG